jgi:hypothetical protein
LITKLCVSFPSFCFLPSNSLAAARVWKHRNNRDAARAGQANHRTLPPHVAGDNTEIRYLALNGALVLSGYASRRSLVGEVSTLRISFLGFLCATHSRLSNHRRMNANISPLPYQRAAWHQISVTNSGAWTGRPSADPSPPAGSLLWVLI